VLAERLVPVAWRGVVADAVLVTGGALLVALAARIEIPLGFTPVPISGQTFGVLVVGAGLGFARGGSSLGLYLLLGLAGAPVFAGGRRGRRGSSGPPAATSSASSPRRPWSARSQSAAGTGMSDRRSDR
jgi:biotin transport system substrate-specific component